MDRKRVLIAAAGTGGHLFPAQALAQELQAEGIEVLFAGHGLSSNRYFRREAFAFEDVASATPYGKNAIKSLFEISKGIKKSLRLVRGQRPDLVVGFGSFHSFPVLVAAFLHRVPILLFEANSIPGKVNRLFSRWATLSAVHFPQAARRLHSATQEVAMPIWKGAGGTQEKARAYFSLDPKKRTLLIFGGSQGAVSINALAPKLASLCASEFQVVHLTGEKGAVQQIAEGYTEGGVEACVKAFEPRMDLAWQAASLAICRAGAASLAEMIEYEVPALLLPYPHASDDHQRRNAECMEKLGAALYLRTPELVAEAFAQCKQHLPAMREAIRAFKQNEQKPALAAIIQEMLCSRSTS